MKERKDKVVQSITAYRCRICPKYRNEDLLATNLQAVKDQRQADEASLTGAQRAAHHDHQHEQVDDQFLGPGKLAVAQLTNNNVCKGDHGDKNKDDAQHDLLELSNAAHDLFVGFHSIIPFLFFSASTGRRRKGPWPFSILLRPGSLRHVRMAAALPTASTVWT